MNESLLSKLNEFNKLSNYEKEKLGKLLYQRIVNSIALSLNNKNTIISEGILLSFIRNIFFNIGEVDYSLTIFTMHISTHIFDYEEELAGLLEEQYQEYKDDLSHYLKNKNQYVNADLVDLVLLMISVKEDKKISPQIEEILNNLY